MVILAHAVADPGAVVVHSDDALLTDRAMMHAFLFYHIAFEAVTHFVQCLYILEVYLVLVTVLTPLLFLLGLGARVHFDLFDFLAVVHVLA